MTPFYRFTTEEIFPELKTTVTGLKNETVPALQEKFGANSLTEIKQKSKLFILLGQFNDIMIIILVIAAIISFVSGEHTDAFVVVAIIVANAWMGFSQENKAEESVRMLKKMSAQYALVLRSNNHLKIETDKLVPGDIILLEAGDIVPADARLIEVNSFKTDEASLTGESYSVEKITAEIEGVDLVPGDQHNMVFKGTIVSNGTAKAVVTTIGMNTEIGKIAGLMDVGSQKTPLQKKLAVFSKQLAVIVILICLLVFGLGLLRGAPPFQMFLTALSLAVAALPEALPAVITIALAQGASRMVRQKALIRKLPAVETLGSVTYICTDKTGTLTQNVMTVEHTMAATDQQDLLMYSMLINNEVRYAEDGKLIGDSTETALVHHALKNGYLKTQADTKFGLLSKFPFDSIRMRMSSFYQHEEKWILFVKGAPIKISETLSEKYKEQVPAWLEQNRVWAAEGLRVLFFAYGIFDEYPAVINADIEKELDFLGMVAMIDPPREEVIDAIRQCKAAGIKTVMITGDQPLTARAIAERLHIVENGTAEVKTGTDLDKLTEAEFSHLVESVRVYARVSPEQKLKIVKALQSNGEFVAMTGDGVNDAPSLKQADIGLAMGITGTDVAKDAADMILLDDNFTSIVKAVKEGRRIYENIRKFILYILSCNLSEILTIFLAPLLGLTIPLLPIHILWINLVTDGLPGIALVAEPAEKNIMQKPPRSPKENLFAEGLILRICSTGMLLTAAAISIHIWAVNQGYDIKTQQTMVFTTLCFVQLGNALSVRSTVQSIFSSTIFSNRGMWGAIILTTILQLCIVYIPFLQTIFKTTALNLVCMIAILVVTLVCICCIELIKKFYKTKAVL